LVSRFKKVLSVGIATPRIASEDHAVSSLRLGATANVRTQQGDQGCAAEVCLTARRESKSSGVLF
jgi:hypothetical protein